jgi:zinc/manganese transport system substrate-binding protein
VLRTRPLALAALAAALLLPSAVRAAEPLRVVATFSVLGDMAREVGGGLVEVATLVGPDGDAHVYEPSPADGRAVAGADVLVVNGLGFEGWIGRLEQAAGFGGVRVVATVGVAPLGAGGGGHGHGHDDGDGRGPDPHAWQSLANGRLYAANIAAGLAAADPGNAAVYRRNAAAYATRLDALDAELRASLARLPPERRRIVTSHDAFGYLAEAYGLEFLAPQGVSTAAEASAGDVSALIRQVRDERITAVFVENVADPRLLEQVTRETGAEIGGTLYSDALSAPGGPAPTYVEMFRHNLRTLVDALTS